MIAAEQCGFHVMNGQRAGSRTAFSTVARRIAGAFDTRLGVSERFESGDSLPRCFRIETLGGLQEELLPQACGAPVSMVALGGDLNERLSELSYSRSRSPGN